MLDNLVIKVRLSNFKKNTGSERLKEAKESGVVMLFVTRRPCTNET